MCLDCGSMELVAQAVLPVQPQQRLGNKVWFDRQVATEFV
jgi:hypothetical protein